MGLWIPSLWRKVGGSTRLGWISILFVEICMTLACGPFLSLYDVAMQVCLIMNREVLTIDQIETYMFILIYLFFLAIPLFFISSSVILIGVAHCRRSAGSIQERSNIWVQHKSLSLAHVLICVVSLVLGLLWLFVFSTAGDVTFESHENIMYRNLLMHITVSVLKFSLLR